MIWKQLEGSQQDIVRGGFLKTGAKTKNNMFVAPERTIPVSLLAWGSSKHGF